MRWPFLLFVVLAACGEAAATSPTADASGCAGFVGDPAQPVAIEALVAEPTGGDNPFRPLTPVAGSRIPLIASPTGAVFIFGAARVKNVDTCQVFLTAGLRDMAGHVVSQRRQMDLVATGNGWASAADLSTYSGYTVIPACPNTWADADIQEQPYQLELEVTDGGGRTAKTMVSVVPFCAEPGHLEQCLGTCKKGGP